MKAFPNKGYITDADGVLGEAHFSGMDLRDYFASKALQGMLSDHTTQCNYDEESYEEFAQGIAESAYIFADSMIKAREKND